MIRTGTLCLIVSAPGLHDHLGPPAIGKVVTTLGPARWSTRFEGWYYPTDLASRYSYVHQSSLRPISDPDADTSDTSARDKHLEHVQ